MKVQVLPLKVDLCTNVYYMIIWIITKSNISLLSHIFIIYSNIYLWQPSLLLGIGGAVKNKANYILC